MKVLRTRFWKLSKSFAFLVLAIIISLSFFWKTFVKKQYPIPGDFVVGVYYPWLDYKWGYPAGVPVKNPMTTDVVSLIYPEQVLAAQQLLRGEWPLWNPYILTGTPLMANLQAAPFSPTIFLFWLFDEVAAWSYQVIAAHVLVVIFTYALMRHWKVSKLGSAFSAIAFSFSGFNMIFSQWNGHTLSAAFIPLAVLFQDRLLKEKRVVDGIGLSASLAFQMLSGYPQVTLYTALALGLLWIVRGIGEVGDIRRFAKKSLFLGLFISLGFGLAAIQLIPAIELWQLSQRSFEPHPYEWAFLPWKKIITFIAPDFFGNHATANYWGPQDYTSNTAYIGVVVSIFSLLSIKLIRKSKTVLFLVVLSIITLFLSFPTPVSLFLWKYNIFGMRAASAQRATVLFIFAASTLAGFGIDEFVKLRGYKFLKSFKYLAIPWVIICSFGLATLYLYITTQGNVELSIVRGIPKYWVALRNLVLPTGVLLTSTVLFLTFVKYSKRKKFAIYLFFALMVFELFRFGWKYTPFSKRELIFPPTPVLEYLVNKEKPYRVTGNKVIPNNMRTPYELDSLEGYETIHPLRISQFLAALNSGIVGASPVGRYGAVDNDTSHLLDLVNTKYYLSKKQDEKGNPDANGEIPKKFRDDRFKVAFEDKTVVVMESKYTLPRAFMVYDWQREYESTKILDLLLNEDFEYHNKIVLEEEAPITKTQKKVKNEISYLKYGEQKSEIGVSTDEDGMLFISDAFYPGWKAFVDGVETKIIRANFAFRAIPLYKGKHTVVMRYEPESFDRGLTISGVSVLVITAMFLTSKFLRKEI